MLNLLDAPKTICQSCHKPIYLSKNYYQTVGISTRELLIGFVSFVFGVLSHIVYGIINDSRTKARVKQALIKEIQANYFQIRGHLKYAADQREALERMDRFVDSDGVKRRPGESLVIGHYRFSHVAFDTNVSDIHLLGDDITARIHHFYSRLRTLEDTAQAATRLFEQAKEISYPDGDYKAVKVIDATKLSAHFQQTMQEYEHFERQAYDIGTDLLNTLQ